MCLKSSLFEGSTQSSKSPFCKFEDDLAIELIFVKLNKKSSIYLVVVMELRRGKGRLDVELG